MPESLQSVYGNRLNIGFAAFVTLRPGEMKNERAMASRLNVQLGFAAVRTSNMKTELQISSGSAHNLWRFWGVVQPVNAEMMRWPVEAIPQDWTNWRDRWEYGHAVRAGLATAGLGALTLSPVCD